MGGDCHSAVESVEAAPVETRVIQRVLLKTVLEHVELVAVSDIDFETVLR